MSDSKKMKEIKETLDWVTDEVNRLLSWNEQLQENMYELESRIAVLEEKG